MPGTKAPGRPRLPEDHSPYPSGGTVQSGREEARAVRYRTRERLRPILRAIVAEFLDRDCVDCGVQFPAPVMQADHVRGKKYSISWLASGNGSEKVLREELAKCEVRCANCHVLRHAAEKGD